MSHVLDHGHRKADRTGTGTLSVFGWQMRFDLQQGFPLLTTKKLHTRSIIHELLWFIRGETNIRYLKENGVSIWDDWADETGELGPVYGKQWRHWSTPRAARWINCRTWWTACARTPTPASHRLRVEPAEVERMALPPCHALFQLYVADGRLSCQLYQRSADIFLGVPFNIASYAMLTMMLAQICGLEPGDFVWTGGDCHLYINHLDQARLQLSRSPRPLPRLRLNPEVREITDFRFEDFTLEGYDPTRISRHRWRYETRRRSHPDRRRWQEPGDRHRQSPAVAPEGRPAALQATDDRLPGDHGAQDLGILGRPLPGRHNIVITRDDNYQAAGAQRASSLDDAFALCAGAARIFVIGGAQIYAAAMPHADALELTEVDAAVDGTPSSRPSTRPHSSKHRASITTRTPTTITHSISRAIGDCAEARPGEFSPASRSRQNSRPAALALAHQAVNIRLEAGETEVEFTHELQVTNDRAIEALPGISKGIPGG